MITKQEFERYLKVQKSGKTNMFNVNYVCLLSKLPRFKVMEIMENYEQLNKEYGVKNE